MKDLFIQIIGVILMALLIILTAWVTIFVIFMGVFLLVNIIAGLVFK